MTTWIVGEGGNFTTIAQVLAAVQPGDVVELLTGVYKDALKITKANTTWRAVAGNTPVLDGSYSHEWAKKSGTSWRDLVYRSPSGGTVGNIVTVAANGVTIEGLTIRNSGAAGIGAGAVDGLTVRNCLIEHTYETSIVVNGTKGTARNITLEGNTCSWASMKQYDPKRVDGAQAPQNVSGVIKVGSASGVVIRGNTVSRGNGEGINIGKDAEDVLCEGNVVYDCSHLHIYVNRSRRVTVRNNLIFFTDDPAAIGADNDAPCGMGLRDEKTAHGVWGISGDVTWEGNTVINAGYPFLLNSEGGRGFTVRGNTFISGPTSRKGINIVGPQFGVFEDNVIFTLPGKPMTDGNPAGISFANNHWSYEPPAAWRGEGDVYGPPDLKAPDVLPTAEHEPFGMGRGYSIDPDNYRARVIVEPPPDEPPDEPPISETAVTPAELEAVAEQLAVAGLAVGEAMMQIDALRERLGKAVG